MSEKLFYLVVDWQGKVVGGFPQSLAGARSYADYISRQPGHRLSRVVEGYLDWDRGWVIVEEEPER